MLLIHVLQDWILLFSHLPKLSKGRFFLPTYVVIITGSSLTLAKMLRAEKHKQQAKMHKKKFIDNH